MGNRLTRSEVKQPPGWNAYVYELSGSTLYQYHLPTQRLISLTLDYPGTAEAGVWRLYARGDQRYVAQSGQGPICLVDMRLGTTQAGPVLTILDQHPTHRSVFLVQQELKSEKPRVSLLDLDSNRIFWSVKTMALGTLPGYWPVHPGDVLPYRLGPGPEESHQDWGQGPTAARRFQLDQSQVKYVYDGRQWFTMKEKTTRFGSNHRLPNRVERHKPDGDWLRVKVDAAQEYLRARSAHWALAHNYDPRVPVCLVNLNDSSRIELPAQFKWPHVDDWNSQLWSRTQLTRTLSPVLSSDLTSYVLNRVTPAPYHDSA